VQTATSEAWLDGTGASLRPLQPSLVSTRSRSRLYSKVSRVDADDRARAWPAFGLHGFAQLASLPRAEPIEYPLPHALGRCGRIKLIGVKPPFRPFLGCYPISIAPVLSGLQEFGNARYATHVFRRAGTLAVHAQRVLLALLEVWTTFKQDHVPTRRRPAPMNRTIDQPTFNPSKSRYNACLAQSAR
jgi:hypothetical protein